MSPRSYPEPRRTKPPTLGDVSRGQHEPPHSQRPSWEGKADPRMFTDYRPPSHRRAPERQWNVLQIGALVLVIEALCFVAFLWGQGWRP